MATLYAGMKDQIDYPDIYVGNIYKNSMSNAQDRKTFLSIIGPCLFTM